MKPTRKFSSSLRYQIDNLFSRGTGVMILWLALLSGLIVILAGIFLYNLKLAPGTEQAFTFPEALWVSMIRTLGGGSAGGRESQLGYRMVMLGLTFGGIFFTSALIGILTTGLNARMETLRRGRSLVVEKEHIVILGWTPQVFSILSELVSANADKPKACIVILGEEDKTRMEEVIRQKLPHRGRVKIVCRRGSPMEMDDLKIANINASRAVIVLSPEVENPDAEVIKTILAITNHPQRRAEPYHIIAGVRSPKNYEITRVVGKGEVEWVRPADMAARMIAQTCRQSGLSTVYTGLLDYGSDEIYFMPAGSLAGCTFGDLLHYFPDAALMGIKPADGSPSLNPGMQRVVLASDMLILIAHDDSQLQLPVTGQGQVDQEAIRAAQPQTAGPEKTLILGWNWRGPRVVEELDYYVAPGSQVMVVADTQEAEADLARDCQDLKRQTVCFQIGDTSDRHTLESLDLAKYDHIILLCYSDRLSPQQADALTMITLLHLRDLADANGYHYSIVSEMMDVRNRKLAAVTRADDFIVSDRLVSLLMAQVAENRWINAVFTDLFNQGGSEIYLRPAGNYFDLSKSVNFYTITEAARRRGEVAIGYRLASSSRDADKSFGVVLNPAKTAEAQYSAADRIIVLAES